MNRRGRICNQIVETFNRRAHANHYGHGLKVVVEAALDEFLHNRRGTSRRNAFHAAMRLVYDEINFIGLSFDCVAQRLPNRVLSKIRVARQIAALAEFLRVEKINLAVVQSLRVKIFILNHEKLRVIYSVCIEPKFIKRLSIEFGRIAQPNKNRVRLCKIIFVAAINLFHQCRQHYRFAGSRRCRE